MTMVIREKFTTAQTGPVPVENCKDLKGEHLWLSGLKKMEQSDGYSAESRTGKLAGASLASAFWTTSKRRRV